MKPTNALSAPPAKAAKQKKCPNSALKPNFDTKNPTVEVSQQWDLPAFTRFAVARCKGLEPLTYWFVASHSIQLS